MSAAVDPSKNLIIWGYACTDLTYRLLPLSYFEKHASGQAKAGITINISGLTDAKVDAEQTIDAEDVQYNDN